MSYYQLKSLLSASNGLDFDLAHLKTITSNINSLKDIHDCIKLFYDFLSSEHQVEILRCLWVIKNWSKLQDTFRDIAATSLNTKIKCLVNYKGGQDPLYGTSLYERIHALSEDCLDVMFVDNEQKRRESISGRVKSMVGASSTNYNKYYGTTTNKSTPIKEAQEADPYSVMRQNLMDKLKSPKKLLKFGRSIPTTVRSERLTDSNQISQTSENSFFIKDTNNFSIHKNTKTSRIFHIIKGSRIGPLLNALEKNKLKNIFSEETLKEYIEIFTKYEYSSIQGTKLYESFLLFQKTSFYKSCLKSNYSALSEALDKELEKCKSAMSKKFVEEILKENEKYKPEFEKEQEIEEKEKDQIEEEIEENKEEEANEAKYGLEEENEGDV